VKNPPIRACLEDPITVGDPAVALMSSLHAKALQRWRVWWQATKLTMQDRRLSLDSRLVALTFVNALLYWPWRWLRIAFDDGDHHPVLVLGMMLLTLWLWAALVEAVLDRFKGVKRSSQGGSPGRDL
jgi:hypothetical protein